MFINEELNLRIATNEDMDLLYEWANDRTVRENAFHTEPIPYETHISWFARIMQDEDEILYILEKDNRPIGQIRFSIGGGGGRRKLVTAYRTNIVAMDTEKKSSD